MTKHQPFPPRDGLTEAEAADRLARFGPNLIQESRRRGLLQVARGTLREPMFLLLLLAASLYLVLGSLGEGLFLLAGATVSLGLVILQELRSEHALAALNALAEPMAHVVRDGAVRTVPARQIVPGDLLIVAEGGRLAVDGVLVHGDALTVDESALTGEAASVTKCAATGLPPADADPIPGEAMSANLFAGTLIVRGQGSMVATRTGPATRFGRIGAALAGLVEQPTLLQRNVGRLIRRLGILALAFCILVALSYGLILDRWLPGILAGITLAIALLPEEFPMVLAVFMALGAWRLARHNVIVRRSAVIETLGATTLLCVDKTGTLTENRMALESLWRGGRLFELGAGALPPDVNELLAAARLASSVQPHDPMDIAVQAAAGGPAMSTPLRSYPLRPELLAFVQVWPAGESGGVVYAAKGAPETIFKLCGMDEATARQAEAAVGALADRGKRVLAVAEARFDSDPRAEPANLAYRFLGLLGFADPVRPEVPGALQEARRAGIAVAMVTGDYPATALAVALAAGMDVGSGPITGPELARAGDLAEGLSDVRVFARIMPEQKLQLVAAFRAAGHVVAMTGDGINDAAALAAADIGIAMGRRGTDVAREASDLVLLDDSFASIVGGIRLGRRIFANLRRAMIFITAIHIPIAGLALLPILLGLPPLMLPMHVVLLELLIDPLCSLVFEGEPSEADAMARPPRPAGESLFGTRHILLAMVQGSVLLAAVLGLYWWSLSEGVTDGAARASAFVALIAGNLSLALAEASSGSAKLLDPRRMAFWAIGGIAILVVTLCLTLPQLRAILQFSGPSPGQLLAALLAGSIAGGWYRLTRLFTR